MNKDFDAQNIFGKGTPNTGFAQYFTGESFLNPLTSQASQPYFWQM